MGESGAISNAAGFARHFQALATARETTAGPRQACSRRAFGGGVAGAFSRALDHVQHFRLHRVFIAFIG